MRRFITAESGNYYILICLFLGIVCLVHFFTQKNYYPYIYSKEINSSVITGTGKGPGQIFNISKADSTDRKDLMLFLFEQRKEHYANTLETLGSSINRMAFLILISIMLLYFQPSDLELFGIKIPNLAIYLIVPVCILYYWLLFGFSLFNSLASRESLFHLSRNIEAAYFKDKEDKVYLLHSARNSLEDIGIIDAWGNVFLGFYDDNYQHAFEQKETRKTKINTSDPVVAVGLFVIFGGLQALAMGSAQSMIYYYKRYLTKRHKRAVVFLEVVLFSYFLLSHLTFFIAMPYSTLYLSSIWFLAAVFFYFTLRALNNNTVKQEVNTVADPVAD